VKKVILLIAVLVFSASALADPKPNKGTDKWPPTIKPIECFVFTYGDRVWEVCWIPWQVAKWKRGL
jgi:hypothetical protein